MNHKEYAEQILKTERTDKVSKLSVEAVEAMEEFIRASMKLDFHKKNLFFGKPIDRELYKEAENFSLSDMNRDVSDINSRYLHAMIGIATEAGEVLQVLTDAKLGLKPSLDLVNLCEEMGGVDWYSTLASDEMGVYQEVYREALQKQLAFRHRGSEGFSVDGSNNRDKEAEAKLLKSFLQDHLDEAQKNKEVK